MDGRRILSMSLSLQFQNICNHKPKYHYLPDLIRKKIRQLEIRKNKCLKYKSLYNMYMMSMIAIMDFTLDSFDTIPMNQIMNEEGDEKSDCAYKKKPVTPNMRIQKYRKELRSAVCQSLNALSKIRQVNMKYHLRNRVLQSRCSGKELFFYEKLNQRDCYQRIWKHEFPSRRFFGRSSRTMRSQSTRCFQRNTYAKQGFRNMPYSRSSEEKISSEGEIKENENLSTLEKLGIRAESEVRDNTNSSQPIESSSTLSNDGMEERNSLGSRMDLDSFSHVPSLGDDSKMVQKTVSEQTNVGTKGTVTIGGKDRQAEVMSELNFDDVDLNRENKCAQDYVDSTNEKESGDVESYTQAEITPVLCVDDVDLNRENKCAQDCVESTNEKKTGDVESYTQAEITPVLCVDDVDLNRENKCAQDCVESTNEKKTGDVESYTQAEITPVLCVDDVDLNRENKCAQDCVESTNEKKTGDVESYTQAEITPVLCVDDVDLNRENKCAQDCVESTNEKETGDVESYTQAEITPVLCVDDVDLNRENKCAQDCVESTNEKKTGDVESYTQAEITPVLCVDDVDLNRENKCAQDCVESTNEKETGDVESYTQAEITPVLCVDDVDLNRENKCAQDCVESTNEKETGDVESYTQAEITPVLCVDDVDLNRENKCAQDCVESTNEKETGDVESYTQAEITPVLCVDDVDLNRENKCAQDCVESTNEKETGDVESYTQAEITPVLCVDDVDLNRENKCAQDCVESTNEKKTGDVESYTQAEITPVLCVDDVDLNRENKCAQDCVESTNEKETGDVESYTQAEVMPVLNVDNVVLRASQVKIKNTAKWKTEFDKIGEKLEADKINHFDKLEVAGKKVIAKKILFSYTSSKKQSKKVACNPEMEKIIAGAYMNALKCSNADSECLDKVNYHVFIDGLLAKALLSANRVFNLEDKATFIAFFRKIGCCLQMRPYLLQCLNSYFKTEEMMCEIGIMFSCLRNSFKNERRKSFEDVISKFIGKVCFNEVLERDVVPYTEVLLLKYYIDVEKKRKSSCSSDAFLGIKSLNSFYKEYPPTSQKLKKQMECLRDASDLYINVTERTYNAILVTKNLYHYNELDEADIENISDEEQMKVINDFKIVANVLLGHMSSNS